MKYSKCILWMIILFSILGCSEKSTKLGRIGAFFNSKETYKSTEKIQVVDDLQNCDAVKTEVPINSYFTVINNADKNSWVIEFINTSNDKNNPIKCGEYYRLCIDDSPNNPNNYTRFTRVGGLTTGVLVVPYKYRGHDTISGEATVGPYVGFKTEHMTFAVGVGLTQISVSSKDDDKKIDSKTGFTWCVGLIREINKNFDIGIILGQDTVFGKDNGFEYQHKTWGSLAIGYKFTTN